MGNQEKICNDFYYNLKGRFGSHILTFKEIKEIDSFFIEKKLYKPVCENVVYFLNKNCNAPSNTQNLFNFLTGKLDFYKVIVRDNSIQISEFINIKIPMTVNSFVYENSYVMLDFDNNWKFAMRLHTASSRIAGCEGNSCSLKFDTTLTKDNVNSYYI